MVKRRVESHGGGLLAHKLRWIDLFRIRIVDHASRAPALRGNSFAQSSHSLQPLGICLLSSIEHARLALHLIAIIPKVIIVHFLPWDIRLMNPDHFVVEWHIHRSPLTLISILRVVLPAALAVSLYQLVFHLDMLMLLRGIACEEVLGEIDRLNTFITLVEPIVSIRIVLLGDGRKVAAGGIEAGGGILVDAASVFLVAAADASEVDCDFDAHYEFFTGGEGRVLSMLGV